MEFLKTPFCNILLFAFQCPQSLTFFRVEKFVPGPIILGQVLSFQGFSKIVSFVFSSFYLKSDLVCFGAASLIGPKSFSQLLKWYQVKQEAANFCCYFSSQTTS